MFQPFYRNCSGSTQREIFRVYAGGEEKLQCRRWPNPGGSGGMLPPENFAIQGLRNAIDFQRFPQDISRKKFVQLFILPIFSVVGNKVQCLREKRPVTPSELWNKSKDKRNINTRTPIQCEKWTSHPSFLADSPLAPRACSHSTVSKRKIETARSLILMTPFR